MPLDLFALFDLFSNARIISSKRLGPFCAAISISVTICEIRILNKNVELGVVL